MFRCLHWQEMRCELCSCPGVGTSATLCPQSTWASEQCTLSHCHALTGELLKETSPSPQQQQYWGTFCTMLGENITFQPPAPLTGASICSFLPSSPSCPSLRTQGSRFSAVHPILQSLRSPRWLHSLLSPCSHREASCKLLASWSGKHTDGLVVQSEPSSL